MWRRKGTDKVIIQFARADVSESEKQKEKPPVAVQEKRGVHYTSLCISREAAEGLFHVIYNFLKVDYALPNKDQEVKECDATMPNSSKTA